MASLIHDWPNKKGFWSFLKEVVIISRYVPAYSTRLKYESGIWDVLPADSSDPMGMLDPVWTESFWDVIGLRVYTVQDTGYDHLVLAGGIAVTVSAYVAIVVARAFITKALKRDWEKPVGKTEETIIHHRIDGYMRKKKQKMTPSGILPLPRRQVLQLFLSFCGDVALFELHHWFVSPFVKAFGRWLMLMGLMF